MNAKTAKLLRKVAKISQRAPKYIKKQYKLMPPGLQRPYILFMKENIRRLAEAKKNSPIITDQKVGEDHRE